MQRTGQWQRAAPDLYEQLAHALEHGATEHEAHGEPPEQRTAQENACCSPCGAPQRIGGAQAASSLCARCVSTQGHPHVRWCAFSNAQETPTTRINTRNAYSTTTNRTRLASQSRWQCLWQAQQRRQHARHAAQQRRHRHDQRAVGQRVDEQAASEGAEDDAEGEGRHQAAKGGGSAAGGQDVCEECEGHRDGGAQRGKDLNGVVVCVVGCIGAVPGRYEGGTVRLVTTHTHTHTCAG